MNKKVLMAVLLASALLTACANGNQNSTEDTNESNVASKDDRSTMQVMADKMVELDFIKLDFDVLYAEDEFEGQVNDDDGLVESEYYDPFNNVDARGSAAFDAIYPILQELDLDQDMSNEDAIAASIEVFNLPDDFLKAELEIIFNDGTEKEFEVRKDEM